MVDVALRAIYYPFSRTLEEYTLKRALLLYDEILFIDPTTSKVRAGLYDVAQHRPYLPPDTASRLSEEWTSIAERYALLETEGLVRFVDPDFVLKHAAANTLITAAMQADMQDPQVVELFGNHPQTWSMLRSRIPTTAMPFLHNEYTLRVLFPENTTRAFKVINGFGHALIVDGNPDQELSHPGYYGMSAEVDGEWAAVLPYYLGSSLATSTALAMAVQTGATPLTDSDAHFKLMSARFARAGAAAQTISGLPGLTPTASDAGLQKHALIEQRLVDSVLDKEALDALSLEDCLRYREETAKERSQFRSYLASVVKKMRADPWSPEIESEIAELVEASQQELQEQAGALRGAYFKLFKRTVTGLGIASAPVLLTALFPGVSALWAVLLGGGTLSGILADPIKDLADVWLDRKDDVNALTYLMQLPHPTT